MKEKIKKGRCGRNIYKNVPEEDKQRLKKYQKHYCKAQKLSKKKLIFLSLNSSA